MKSAFDQLNLRPLERRMVVVGLIIIFIVVNYVWVRPQFKQWSVVQADIRRLSGTLAQYQAKVKQLPELLKKEAELKGSEDFNPDTDNKSLDLQRVAEARLRATGLVGNGLYPGPRHPVSDYFEEQTLQIPFNNAADTNLVQFLVSISQDSLIRVQSLNLKPDAGQTRLMGSVVLVATYSSQSGTSAKPGAPAPRHP
jgi:type II secretory pathway component PulM